MFFLLLFMAMVILSASAERFGVSRMRDFFKAAYKCTNFKVGEEMFLLTCVPENIIYI